MPVPIVFVDDVAAAFAHSAALVYGSPSSALEVVGITGTNGKTTTVYLVRAAVDAALGRRGVRRHGHDRALVRDLASRDRAHDAGGRRRGALDGADARSRRHPSRDGSFVTRDRARARGGRAIPGGRAHQPYAGPPRFSRIDGGLRACEGAALRGACSGQRRVERGRPLRT
jgi:hypothetical protein